MGKTILAAIVAAILASVATTLVMRSVADDQARRLETRLTEIETRAAAADERVGVALDRVDRQAARVERAESGAVEAQRTAAAALQAAGVERDPDAPATALVAPDGTEYVSRAELDRLIAERGAGGMDGLEIAPPRPAMTVAEIAADMGLTAQQEATLVAILREAEQELVNRLFGNRSIEDVKAEVIRAKDDPDAQAVLIQGVIARGVGNAGYLMTYDQRLRRRVEGALGPERAQEFLERPRKPVLDPELESFFDDVFR